MEHFLQGNVSLRHLLNAKLPFMSCRRSGFNEVNDWSLKTQVYSKKNIYGIKKRQIHTYENDIEIFIIRTYNHKCYSLGR